MSSGIYQIRNTLNDKCYIGSAVNLQRRWSLHLAALCCGQHRNSHLQRAFDKYGEATFSFIILEDVKDPEMLIKREQFYLDTLLPEYNIAPTAGSKLGVRCTEETKQKISVANTGKLIGKRNPMYGKHHSAVIKQKISEATAGERHPNYGKHHSVKTLAKMSAAKIGKRPSEKTLAKMSAANIGERNPNYGKHPSEDTLEKMSAAKIGERNPFYGKHHSAMTLAKISVANTDKHPSKEARAKRSAAMTGERHPFYGKHHSDETKRKMSIAMKAYWRRVREAKEGLND